LGCYKGDIPNEAEDTVNMFSHFFSTVVTSLKSNSIPLMNFTWRFALPSRFRINTDFKIDYLSNVIVENELRKLKRSKATGID